MTDTNTVLEDIRQRFVNEFEDPDGSDGIERDELRSEFSHVSDEEFEWCIDKLIFDEVIERGTDEQGVAFLSLSEKMMDELMEAGDNGN
jgi:hypothetical protein